MGKISKRPISINAVMVSLLRMDRAAKLLVGPSVPIPGPMLLRPVSAAGESFGKAKLIEGQNQGTDNEQEYIGVEKNAYGGKGVFIHAFPAQRDRADLTGMNHPMYGAAHHFVQQKKTHRFDAAGRRTGTSAHQHKQQENALGCRGPQSIIFHGKAGGGDRGDHLKHDICDQGK